jgi:hypothetical protein
MHENKAQEPQHAFFVHLILLMNYTLACFRLGYLVVDGYLIGQSRR